MSKGFLKIAILSVESSYFNNRDFSIHLKTDEAVLTTQVPKCDHPHHLNPQYNLFPLSDHLEVTLFENQDTDTRVGYFKIPLTKLYELPSKNHLINTRCVWLEKEAGKVEEGAEVSGVVKLSVIYLDNYTGNFMVKIHEAFITESTEAFGKMDPFLECKVGDVCSQTDTLEEAGQNPQWKQTLSFILESIPSKILFTVKDKDMVNDDVVGCKTINPQQERYLVESEEPIEREFEMVLQGKSTGLVKIATHLKLMEMGQQKKAQ